MESQLLDRVAQLKRPEDTEPPTDRKLDNSYTIDGESLESLLPLRWLDDGVINTFLRSLCLARPGKCVTFDSTTLNYLQGRLESEEAASLTQTAFDELFKPFRTLAATVTGNHGLVFMPFCAENHWVLAVADFRDQRIRVYDSQVKTDDGGEVTPSDLVIRILQYVRCTLNFCIEGYQWTVDHMWLPIPRNDTDCGVYICLMALQHACKPRFTPYEYVSKFRDWNGNFSFYKLDACYWLAGRKIILEVCRRYFRPDPAAAQPTDVLVGRVIDEEFRHFFEPFPPPLPFYQFSAYSDARSRTLCSILDGLAWFIHAIEQLGSTQKLQENEGIQQEAREVVLTPQGAPFLNEIVDEAMSYAWHDVEALHNLRVDLIRARDWLQRREEYLTQARLSIQPALWDHHYGLAQRARMQEDAEQRARMEENAEQSPSVTVHGSPSSPGEHGSAGSWEL